MFKTKFIILALMAVLISVPAAFAVAGDAAPGVSYSAKKQGLVPFRDKGTEQAAAHAADSAKDAAADVSAIEPAAGADDAAPAASKKEDNALADSLKLPRKN